MMYPSTSTQPAPTLPCLTLRTDTLFIIYPLASAHFDTISHLVGPPPLPLSLPPSLPLSLSPCFALRPQDLRQKLSAPAAAVSTPGASGDDGPAPAAQPRATPSATADAPPSDSAPSGGEEGELSYEEQDLSDVPSDFEAKARNCTKLLLTKNKFTSVPLAVVALRSVVELNLAENMLTELPGEKTTCGRFSCRGCRSRHRCTAHRHPNTSTRR